MSINNELNNSIFLHKIPKKILIPIYSNLVTKPLLQELMNIIEKNPGFEIYFYNPKKQFIWMRKTFNSHQSNFSQLWETFQHAETYTTKRDIFVYSWLFMNGGISIFPELLPKIPLYNIKQKINQNNPLTILFIEDGYFNNDVIITTPRAPFFIKLLEHSCNNILRNKASSPIQRKVHLEDDSATGKFTMRKAFLEYIKNPNYQIPSGGFKNNNICGLPQQLKTALFIENKELHENNRLLKQISLGYADL
jgi:hypothetical protein